MEMTRIKAPVTKAVLWGYKTDITHRRVLGISVNIPAKTFYPPMCFLFVSGESCFHTFSCIDWVGWRLARGEDGLDWSINWTGLICCLNNYFTVI